MLLYTEDPQNYGTTVKDNNIIHQSRKQTTVIQEQDMMDILLFNNHSVVFGKIKLRVQLCSLLYLKA